MDGTSALIGPVSAPPEQAVSEDEVRQLLFFHGRLALAHRGFDTTEIRRLVFAKWLYLNGRLSEV